MNLPRKLPLLARFVSFRGLEESKAVWLCLLMTLGCCRICVGQTIPSWFPKAPPLPPPRGEVIRVGTADELLAAVDRLSGGTILLADGQYKLPRPIILYQKQNIVLRSASGEASKVTLVGKGWERGDDHDDILRISRCEGVTIADLSFADCRSYGIKVEAEHTPKDVNILNCRFRDIGVRAIKGSAAQNSDLRAVKGSVRGCYFENTKTPPADWLFGGDYIAAIDMMALEDWTFSDNVFRNIKGRNGGGRAAIFIWVRSRKVVVERNLIVNCDRGVAFGNPGKSTANIEGERLVYVSESIIRNNFIAGGPDCGIELWYADQVKVLNNSIWRPEQNWNRGIRIGTGTSNTEVANNLVHGGIQSEGGQAQVHHNLSGRLDGYFEEPTSGNLALTSVATNALGGGVPLAEVTEDIRRKPRKGTPDLGAWELERKSEAPYPLSPVISSLKWDDAVLRLKTSAGDNWPITWVGGDLQITAWGDGPGFDEQPPRLSLGFARVWGDPPNIRAEDFATDADTLEGGGSRAIKASGLLQVDGTLYIWVRNYRPPGSDDFTNARLAWSKNYGTNWTWADWHFTDTFGCPEFVQFGPNYANARDDYVYVVSQANDSAYGYSPDIVMARVPKNQVPERVSYEFFAGHDPNGQPRWSSDLKQRQPIFTDPLGTQRIAVTYNSGLKRYMLTTSHRPAGSQATHTPALGVFDAPEPWGPWKTVYYDSHWSGTNRTYHHKFPTKWMSPDGRTLWLLYSGLDGGLYTFCLKKATLETRQTTFYCDPTKGSMRGDGSAEHPWRTIQEVIDAGLIQLCDRQGKPSNPSAPVKPGDTVLLRSGWHGVLSISAGYNQQPITIAAAPGQAPQVGWVEISGGKNWIVRGLTVSPSLAPIPLAKVPHELVSLGERGGEDSADLVVEDCFVYSVLETTNWTGKDWVEKPASGIWLGRHGKHHVARNNYVLNTRFGIQLCAPDCLAEGNVVVNFSADGMRATRDGQVLQYNVIKNNFVGSRDGDDNHDDGIQVFLFNVGTGTVRDVTLRGNIIIARETDGLPFPNPLQGIGCFDGPLIHFLVESNVVCVNHYHGISLYDAQNCTIQDNTCFSRWADRARPWVMLGQKKNQAGGNIVRNNLAHSYNFKADAQVKAEDNGEVSPAAFNQRLTALLTLIDSKFGALHPAAKRPRLEPNQMRTQ